MFSNSTSNSTIQQLCHHCPKVPEFGNGLVLITIIGILTVATLALAIYLRRLDKPSE